MGNVLSLGIRSAVCAGTFGVLCITNPDAIHGDVGLMGLPLQTEGLAKISLTQNFSVAQLRSTLSPNATVVSQKFLVHPVRETPVAAERVAGEFVRAINVIPGGTAPPTFAAFVTDIWYVEPNIEVIGLGRFLNDGLDDSPWSLVASKAGEIEAEIQARGANHLPACLGVMFGPARAWVTLNYGRLCVVPNVVVVGDAWSYDRASYQDHAEL